MKKKDEYIMVGLLCNMAAIITAVFTGLYGGVMIMIALALVGCGLICTIEASKSSTRVKGKRTFHSNAVKFCSDFSRQLDREGQRDKVFEKMTDIGVVVRGKGKEEFKKKADETIRKIYPVY